MISTRNRYNPRSANLRRGEAPKSTSAAFDNRPREGRPCGFITGATHG